MAGNNNSSSLFSITAVAGLFSVVLFGLADAAWACKSAPQEKANQHSWFAFPRMIGASVASDICEWALDMTSSSSDISSSRHRQLSRADQTIQFASHAMENLSQDIAQGGGEYLASLAALMGIPAHQYGVFVGVAQAQFERAAVAGTPVTAEDLVIGLQTAMAQVPAVAFAAAPR